MEPMLFSLAFAVLAALVIGFFVHTARQRRLRQEALQGLANSLGLSFDPGRDYDHDDRYAHLEIFRRGSRRYAYNTVSGRMSLGRHECGIVFGDFHYAVRRSGSNKKKKSERFSYLIVELPWADVPDLLIRAEGFFDRLGAMVGFDDIDFESEEFSRAFFVKSPDRKFAYDLIDRSMMDFLLASRPLLIDLEHGKLCLCSSKRTWEPGQFSRQLAWLGSFLSRWPDHLVARLSEVA
jgi:hypothetical protein